MPLGSANATCAKLSLARLQGACYPFGMLTPTLIRAQAEAAAAVCDRLGAEPFTVLLGDRPIALLHLDTFRRIFAGRTIQPTNVYGMARLEVVEDGVAFQADDPSIRPVVATFAPVTL